MLSDEKLTEVKSVKYLLDARWELDHVVDAYLSDQISVKDFEQAAKSIMYNAVNTDSSP